MFMLARNWGWFALRGVIGVIFGVLTFMNPAMSLASLILVFGAYALVDGVSAVVAAVMNRKGEQHWVAALFGGVAGIAVGLLTFLMPGVTTLALLYLIAAWAIMTGGAQIATAVRLRKVISGEWLLGLAGVLSILLGLVLIVYPGPGALTVVLWIGAYAFVFGIMMIALSLRLRSFGKVVGASGAQRTA